MRPKYSSPGAELVKSSHCRCAHLLLVAPHASFVAVFAGVGFAVAGVGVGFAVAGVAASADAEWLGAMYNRPVLAAAIVSDKVDSVRLTYEKISLRVPLWRGEAHWGTFISSSAACRPSNPT